MPTIVKHYDKKSGKIRVYESTPHYDPVTKQSRPIRKYLGTLDPETNELIPSSGRRGRRPSPSGPQATASDIPAEDLTGHVAALEQAISARDTEISALQSEIGLLKGELRLYKKACGSISKAIGSLPGNL